MSGPRILGAAALVVISVAITASAHSRTQAPPNWRVSFSAAALQIPFDSDERPPVPFDGVPANAKAKDAPKMTIATAQTRDSSQAGRIEARITSAAEYPPLGLAPGVNYLWRDSVNPTLRLVIPADTAYRARWLTVATHDHAPPNKTPRLIVVRNEKGASTKSADASSKSAGSSSKSAAAGSKSPDSVQTALYAMAVCDRDCSGAGSWCIVRDTLLTLKAVELKPPLNAFAAYFARNKVVWKKP